jgi:hypothetical protein
VRIKIFNHLPTHIQCVTNEIKVFKSVLKRFLLSNSFYQYCAGDKIETNEMGRACGAYGGE